MCYSFSVQKRQRYSKGTPGGKGGQFSPNPQPNEVNTAALSGSKDTQLAVDAIKHMVPDGMEDLTMQYCRASLEKEQALNLMLTLARPHGYTAYNKQDIKKALQVAYGRTAEDFPRHGLATIDAALKAAGHRFWHINKKDRDHSVSVLYHETCTRNLSPIAEEWVDSYCETTGTGLVGLAEKALHDIDYELSPFIEKELKALPT